MNERIQALVEQADRWARIMTWSDDPRYGDKPVSDLFNQKFAELIVEEMYDFIMDEVGNDNGIPDLGKVKEHFGVEP